jgi:hypothetical protein
MSRKRVHKEQACHLNETQIKNTVCRCGFNGDMSGYIPVLGWRKGWGTMGDMPPSTPTNVQCRQIIHSINCSCLFSHAFRKCRRRLVVVLNRLAGHRRLASVPLAYGRVHWRGNYRCTFTSRYALRIWSTCSYTGVMTTFSHVRTNMAQ